MNELVMRPHEQLASPASPRHMGRGGVCFGARLIRTKRLLIVLFVTILSLGALCLSAPEPAFADETCNIDYRLDMEGLSEGEKSRFWGSLDIEANGEYYYFDTYDESYSPDWIRHFETAVGSDVQLEFSSPFVRELAGFSFEGTEPSNVVQQGNRLEFVPNGDVTVVISIDSFERKTVSVGVEFGSLHKQLASKVAKEIEGETYEGFVISDARVEGSKLFFEASTPIGGCTEGDIMLLVSSTITLVLQDDWPAYGPYEYLDAGETFMPLWGWAGGVLKKPMSGYASEDAALDDYNKAFETEVSDSLDLYVLWAVTNIRVYRMYNVRSSEHLYTTNFWEYDLCGEEGYEDWVQEDIAWYAPRSSSRPVYRLYNPGLGDHHYTANAAERDVLIANHGWRSEGIAFYSADKTRPGAAPIYRVYNGGLKRGQHHYTMSTGERKALTTLHGWRDEGVDFYGFRSELA